MINDQLVTVCAARLADVTHGVNVQLPLVPRPVGEPAPPNVTVMDAYTHREVAEAHIDDRLLATGPYLLLGPPGEMSLSGVSYAGGQDVQTVMVMYIDGRSESHIAMRNAHRTMRAVRRVLALWFNSLDNGGLQVGSCSVGAPVDLTMSTGIAPGAENVATAQITASLAVSFPLVDRWALGAPAA